MTLSKNDIRQIKQTSRVCNHIWPTLLTFFTCDDVTWDRANSVLKINDEVYAVVKYLDIFISKKFRRNGFITSIDLGQYVIALSSHDQIVVYDDGFHHTTFYGSGRKRFVASIYHGDLSNASFMLDSIFMSVG